MFLNQNILIWEEWASLGWAQVLVASWSALRGGAKECLGQPLGDGALLCNGLRGHLETGLQMYYGEELQAIWNCLRFGNHKPSAGLLPGLDKMQGPAEPTVALAGAGRTMAFTLWFCCPWEDLGLFQGFSNAMATLIINHLPLSQLLWLSALGARKITKHQPEIGECQRLMPLGSYWESLCKLQEKKKSSISKNLLVNKYISCNFLMENNYCLVNCI